MLFGRGFWGFEIGEWFGVPNAIYEPRWKLKPKCVLNSVVFSSG